MVYLQVTRGAPGDRDFVFPDPAETPQTLVLFTQNKPGLADSPAAKKGIKVIISIDDIRWGRRDIKTVQLLYPSMGKMMAKAAGADDAWMVEDGQVTEGTSQQRLYRQGQRGSSPARSRTTSCTGSPAPRCCALPREAQMEVEERAFTIDEAQGGGRGLRHLGQHLRDAGGRDRRRGAGRRHARARWRRGCARSISRKAGRRRSRRFAPKALVNGDFRRSTDVGIASVLRRYRVGARIGAGGRLTGRAMGPATGGGYGRGAAEPGKGRRGEPRPTGGLGGGRQRDGGVSPALPALETAPWNNLHRCGHSAEQVTPGRRPGSPPPSVRARSSGQIGNYLWFRCLLTNAAAVAAQATFCSCTRGVMPSAWQTSRVSSGRLSV